jgi:hypothetical protein
MWNKSAVLFLERDRTFLKTVGVYSSTVTHPG